MSQPYSAQPDTISPRDLVCRLVAAGQCLLPLTPKPTVADIDHVLGKLCAAFGISDEMRQVAKLMWHAKIGLAEAA